MCDALRPLVLATALSTWPAGAAQAGPVLEFTGGTFSIANPSATVGWSFTTNSAITVTALDAFINLSVPSTQVRLYNALGTTLASATVTTGDPTEGSPVSFNSHAITPVNLAANTTYYIAEDVPANSLVFLFETNTPTTTLGIIYGGEVLATGTGQNPTADPSNGHFNPSYFGPNFDAQLTVPEPASIVSASIAVLMVLGYTKATTRGIVPPGR